VMTPLSRSRCNAAAIHPLRASPEKMAGTLT
jgi:hypothetical protein